VIPSEGPSCPGVAGGGADNVSPQQSVERCSTSGRNERVVKARRPVSEDARCDPESSRMSGQSADQATDEIVGRRRTRVLCCFRVSDRLERVCRAATCLRSSGVG